MYNILGKTHLGCDAIGKQSKSCDDVTCSRVTVITPKLIVDF